MTASTVLQHEPEILAARNRVAMANRLPAGWATIAEANEILITTAIETATEFADRAFLACLGMKPKQGEAAVMAIISDMLGQAQAVADLLDATPEQHQRLEIGRAALFDLRLAELQTTAVLPWGSA